MSSRKSKGDYIFNMSEFNNIAVKLLNLICRKYIKIGNVQIGKHSYIGYLSEINAANGTFIKIGKYCSISSGVRILTLNHNLIAVSTFPFYRVTHIKDDRYKVLKNIYIGNDVWIGANTIILPGVTIGDGAVIGAGCLVTKEVPPYAIIGGIPAKIIRYRFNEKTIQKLLKIKWWNFPEQIIIDNIDLFYDLDKFINKFEISDSF